MSSVLVAVQGLKVSTCIPSQVLNLESLNTCLDQTLEGRRSFFLVCQVYNQITDQNVFIIDSDLLSDYIDTKTGADWSFVALFTSACGYTADEEADILAKVSRLYDEAINFLIDP